MVKRAAAKSRAELTPATGDAHGDALSPPRTRSAGRRSAGRESGYSSAASATSTGGRTTRQRLKGDLGASPILSSPKKRTPRSRKPLANLATRQNVHFDVVKIPPASELIPKAKTLKKSHVTLKKATRQLDFDDIIPTPPKSGKGGKKETKKMTILRDLQDRLDGLQGENSPVKQEPTKSRAPRTRGRKSISPSPRKLTVSKLARQLKKELQQNSEQISPMSLRNGKVKISAH